ncbi:N-acetylmuramoyl-L-alanine amidase family protein [Hungatella effluvii]|uniref:N-acetylmuramoyl-L-alanine amidase family protein n=1 Tax=Hungatella effluvii TaxID=1096246 RepID=UPI0022DFFDEF|nr:N-acetylmuramoyl-L-alanine amidase family protein [Hungatella effluvii]
MKKVFKRIFFLCFSLFMLLWIHPDFVYGLSSNRAFIATQSNVGKIPKQAGKESNGNPVSVDPDRVIFKMSHYIDNTYDLPEPAKVTLTLKTGKQPRSNIEISVPDNLKNKIRVNGDLHTLFPEQPTILFIEFTDLNLNSKKPSDSGYLTFYSDGEFLCSINISYYIDGLYDEHMTDDIERYSGKKIRVAGSSSIYKQAGTLYLNKEYPQPLTISFTPYILETDTTDTGLGIEPNNDSTKAVLLNPDGLFEFTDHSNYLEITKGDEKITFQIQMKESVFTELREKAQKNPQEYIGIYQLSDIVLEFRDGCTCGGKMNPLPLVYAVKASEESGGHSSGGSSGSGSGGGSSGGISGAPGSSNTFANNEYNTMVNDDIGWRQSDEGNWFYLNVNGEQKRGWLVDPSGVWYYLDQDGKMVTGWVSIDNTWYYFQPDGCMIVGWLLVNDKWYYLNSDGSMRTGWLQDRTAKWYYFNPDGSMKTGWLQDTDTKWYYLQDDGSMAINKVSPAGT